MRIKNEIFLWVIYLKELIGSLYYNFFIEIFFINYKKF